MDPTFRKICIGVAVICLLVGSLNFFLPSFFRRNLELPPSKHLFIFGDSTVDSGLFNEAKYPYEMDIEEGYHGGRFSNGKTVADYLASSLGKSLPLPYRKNMTMLPNVPINFASGGCGILNTTNPIECLTLKQQVEEFLIFVTLSIDAGDLLFFSIGSNDFIFSLELYKKRPQAFVRKMASDYLAKIQYLYYFGARKYLISNIGPLGCIPDKRVAPDNKCNEDINQVVQDFNSKLTKKLKHFVKYYKGAQVVLADSDVMFSLFLSDPNKYGFKFTDKPCCGTLNKDLQRFECNKTNAVCEDRRQYMFFDGAHPTQQANFYFIENCVSGKICNPLL